MGRLSWMRRARLKSQFADSYDDRIGTAIGPIIPELLGKLDGITVRVPLLNASLTDCVFEVSHPSRYARAI